MKLLLALLTNHDLPKLNRLIRCVENFWPTKELEINTIIVVNTLNPEYEKEVLEAHLPYPVYITKSNGFPGKGKNACAEIFLESDCDYLCQFDGDDLLYPSYAQSMENHLKRFPSMDVLGVIPTDAAKSTPWTAGHEFMLGDLYATVWGISLVRPNNRLAGPRRGYWVDEYLPMSDNYIMLQSKKSAVYKQDEEEPVGEDALYCLELLRRHQEGELQYFLTMSSDLYFVDRSTDNSIQKQYRQADTIDRWKKKAFSTVHPDRSSFDELPFIYIDLLMNHEEKEAWLKNNF